MDIDGRRHYRTGDLGRLPADGVLEYIGRNDHQVQIRGHRVELSAVQQAVASHSRVEKALVIDRETSQGTRDLITYIIGDPTVTADELLGHVATLLPEHMIPTYFVPLGSLPLTENFKLDRSALPAPEVGRLSSGNRFVAPGHRPKQRPPRYGRRSSTSGRSMSRTITSPWVVTSIKALQIVSRMHPACPRPSSPPSMAFITWAGCDAVTAC